jgi:hypothetical protein
LKTTRFVTAAIVAVLFAIPVFGQEAAGGTGAIKPENRSDYYYVNISLEKVVPHSLGYIVTYRKGNFGFAESYLPIKWFSGTAGKAELIRIGGAAAWPYLSVFYKEGKVDHMRLYVRKELAHQSWGALPSGRNVDDRFNVEDLILDR